MERDLGRQRHLLQVQTADWVVGEVVQKLKRIGAYDDAMIVVTADHGVSFLPGAPSRGASEVNYPEVMWTPLIVKFPGEAVGKVDDRPAHSTDILPTIADELGVDVPWKMDGRSLLGTPREDGSRRLSDWALNFVRPTGDKDYIEFDGPAGFARLLKTSASRATGDPALRIYRVGTYATLVGRPGRGLHVGHRPRAPRDARRCREVQQREAGRGHDPVGVRDGNRRRPGEAVGRRRGQRHDRRGEPDAGDRNAGAE